MTNLALRKNAIWGRVRYILSKRFAQHFLTGATARMAVP